MKYFACQHFGQTFLTILLLGITLDPYVLSNSDDHIGFRLKQNILMYAGEIVKEFPVKFSQIG